MNPFAQKMSEMSEMEKTTRKSLSRSGIPRDIRDKILDSTIYGKWSKRLIHNEFESFNKIINIYISISSLIYQRYPNIDPSWFIEIIEKFIDLLKAIPSEPSIVPNLINLLVKIITDKQYLTESQVYAAMPRDGDKYRRTVVLFIKHFKLTHIGVIITRFVDEVVTILSDAFDQMTDHARFAIAETTPQAELYNELFLFPTPDTTNNDIKAIFNKLFQIFTILNILKNTVNDGIYVNDHLIQNLTFKKMLELHYKLVGGLEGGSRKHKHNIRGKSKKLIKRKKTMKRR
jgi:hypothetical protein